jgi:hypothetical protein
MGDQTASTGDNGYNYGAQVLDLFKFGLGAYAGVKTAQIQLEDKSRYDALNGQLYQNGMAANGFNASNMNQNYMPLILGAAAILAVVLLVKD